MSVSEIIILLFAVCWKCMTLGEGECWGGLTMRCILMASQVAVLCSLPLWPSVTALFQAQSSRSDQSDYVLIVNNGRANAPLPAFFLQSCSDSVYHTTFEMVYKLNGYKKKKSRSFLLLPHMWSLLRS